MSSYTVPIDAETERLLRKQLALFEEKFGRPPGPEDPVFFDPDADTPVPQVQKPARFTLGERLVLAMIVGVKDTRSGRMKKISRVISRTFLGGASIKPFKTFGDRATYAIDTFSDLNEDHYLAFLREVVSIRGVDWLELIVNFGGKDYYYICESADDIQLVEGLKAAAN